MSGIAGHQISSWFWQTQTSSVVEFEDLYTVILSGFIGITNQVVEVLRMLFWVNIGEA